MKNAMQMSLEIKRLLWKPEQFGRAEDLFSSEQSCMKLIEFTPLEIIFRFKMAILDEKHETTTSASYRQNVLAAIIQLSS